MTCLSFCKVLQYVSRQALIVIQPSRNSVTANFFLPQKTAAIIVFLKTKHTESDCLKYLAFRDGEWHRCIDVFFDSAFV